MNGHHWDMKLGGPNNRFFRCYYITSGEKFELITLPFMADESLIKSLVMEIASRVFGIYGEVEFEPITIPQLHKPSRLSVKAYGKGGVVSNQIRYKIWQGDCENVEALGRFIVEQLLVVVTKLENLNYYKDSRL